MEVCAERYQTTVGIVTGRSIRALIGATVHENGRIPRGAREARRAHVGQGRAFSLTLPVTSNRLNEPFKSSLMLARLLDQLFGFPLHSLGGLPSLMLRMTPTTFSLLPASSSTKLRERLAENRSPLLSTASISWSSISPSSSSCFISL